MPSQTSLPTSASSPFGSRPWGSPDNIKLADGTFASQLLLGTDTSSLLATGFGFSVPGAATVLGVELVVNRKSDASRITDTSARLVVAGSAAGADRSAGTAWPTVAADRSYGGPADLWSLALTPSDVNNSGFGALLQMADITGTSDTGYVDFMRLTVTYSLGTSGGGAPILLAQMRTAPVRRGGGRRRLPRDRFPSSRAA